MNNEQKRHEQWLRDHKIPVQHKYVEDIVGVIIWRFLSQLADHYNKNPYWISSQWKIYYASMHKIPEKFLHQFCAKWLTEQNGIPLGSYNGYLPTVAHILEYFRARPMWSSAWENRTKNIGEFCADCSYYEGFRDIYIRWKDKQGEIKSELFRGICTCEHAQKTHKKTPYTYHIAKTEAEYEETEISVSYFDHQKNRLISAVEQSAEQYEKRVELGYFGYDDERGFYPIWEHKYWWTSFGLAKAEIDNLNMPEDLRRRIELHLAKDRIDDKNARHKRIKNRSAKDGKVSVPKSIGSYFGYGS